MKANELIKESEPIEKIHNGIIEANKNGSFKFFIPHFVYVNNDVKSQLIKDGYKLYEGNWDSYMNGLIIEW